jgi:hypothetical protein
MVFKYTGGDIEMEKAKIFLAHKSGVVVGKPLNVYFEQNDTIDLVIQASPISMKSIYEKRFIHEEEIRRINDHAIKIGSTSYSYKLLPTYCAPSGFVDLTGVNLVGLKFKEDLAVILGTPETQFLLADGVINIDKIYKEERFKEYKTEPHQVLYLSKRQKHSGEINKM